MTRKKTFQELEFHDAFMFAAAMEDEEICRMVLERVLEIPIKAVKVQSESVLLYNSDYRGIRMDVFADDGAGTVFDVEMQTTNRGNLPRRSRFYQAQMDASALSPGEDFKRLPESFVIFLCRFDPFGRGRCRYTFQERCREDGETLGDGTCKVFLNTTGVHKDDISQELVQFLNYVEHAPGAAAASEDSLIRQIDTRIASLKCNRRMEERYMLFGEMLSDERKEGQKEGESNLLWLIGQMEAAGLAAEIPRLSKEPQFLQEMYQKFHLDK